MKQLHYKTIKEQLDAFKIIFTVLLAMLLINRVSAQKKEDLDVIKNHWMLYSDASNSLYHHLSSEAYPQLEERSNNVKKLKTVDSWRKQQLAVRKTIWDIVGEFPEKTNLNAKMTSSVKKSGYHVENIIYESLPGFFVTASLFIPDNIEKPAPAILFCSGHSTGVYRLESYQLPLLNLVKKGFIVLAIDPIGQGERLQYFDLEEGESTIGSSTQEHSYPSTQVSLLGKSIARYFIWDGIRGIDYLVSRKEVDPKRIGVHGLSGGGTQAAYISALDERVAVSAPACYITSYRRLLESVGDLLKANGHEEIHLVGKGWGTIPATFAALLLDAVTKVTLKNALTSYSDVAEYEEYNWPLSTFIPGVLKTFDLPDCYAALSVKGLKQVEPWSAADGNE